MAEVVRLAVWSGPRNISTALMRAWENRVDTLVVDEPLYAHYLTTTGLDHPGRDEVIAAGQSDWTEVVRELCGPAPAWVRVVYHKQMAHHLTAEVGRDWIVGLTNVLLIRQPREVVSSYLRSRQEVGPDELGLRQQAVLYDELSAEGTPPLVIDAADFLTDPARYLTAWCVQIGVPFSAAMLHWPAGRRETDGVWAPHWYDAVWRSTGFAPPRSSTVELSERDAEVAQMCRPAYEKLHAVRWIP